MKQHINALSISIAAIICAVILAGAWTKSHERSSQTISVTGSGTIDFTSDLIVWNCSFSRKSQTIKDAYTLLKKDAEIVKNYLLKKGVSEKEFVFSSINIVKEYRTEIVGNIRNQVFDGYRLTQDVSIQSNAVEQIESVSRTITELIDQGLELNSQPPQYFYTKLAALKIDLLAKATSDAKARAEQIAKNSDSSLGKLKGANMGVFQITAQNSSEDYTYGGVFNTSSKNKTASITVRLEFGIN